MMGRENCMMCEVHMGKIFCGYYDVFTYECHEVTDCPDGLDGDEDDDLSDYDTEDDIYSEWSNE